MTLHNAISKRIVMLCQEQQISETDLLDRVNADPHAVLAVVKGQDQIILLDLLDKICFALGTTRVNFFQNSLFETF
jgi:DNA-binding Xre family transcriptional regulator